MADQEIAGLKEQNEKVRSFNGTTETVPRHCPVSRLSSLLSAICLFYAVQRIQSP